MSFTPLRPQSPSRGSRSSSLWTRLADAFRRDAQATDAAGWAWNLAIFRIVYLSLGVLPLAVDTFWWTRRTLPGLHPDLWVPVSFFRWLPFGVTTDPALGQALAAILIALVVLGAVGYRTSLVLGLATVVSLFALGLAQNQGKVHHYHNVVWFMAILAVSPCGAALSLDALLRRRAGERVRPSPVGALAAFRYVWALMGVLYLFPGLAKLVAVVTDGWATAGSQRLILWNKWLQLEWYESAIRPLIRPDGLPDAVLAAGALIVVVAEVSLGPAIMLRRTRLAALVVGLGFHLSTGLVLGIFFSWLTPAYVGLVDWSSITGRWRHKDSPRREAERPRRAWSLHAVGGGLLAVEFAVSAMHLLAVIPHRYLPQRTLTVELLASYQSRLFLWPFDAYPFFTTDGPAEISVLEARLVGADGRERRVGAAAFEAGVGRSSASQGLARRLARLKDPVAQRTAAGHLAAALWPHLAPEERGGAQGLRIYVSRFRVAAVPTDPVMRTLVLDMSSNALDTMRARNRE